MIGVSCQKVTIRSKLMTLGTNMETIVMNNWNMIVWGYIQYHNVAWILYNKVRETRPLGPTLGTSF